MVKHTHKVHWQEPANCLNVLDHFGGLALKGLSYFFSESLFSLAEVHRKNGIITSIDFTCQGFWFSLAC